MLIFYQHEFPNFDRNVRDFEFHEKCGMHLYNRHITNFRLDEVIIGSANNEMNRIAGRFMASHDLQSSVSCI